MNLCDSCGRHAVEAKLTKPLFEVHGVNMVRWHSGGCECCKKMADLALYPSINDENIDLLKGYMSRYNIEAQER